MRITHEQNHNWGAKTQYMTEGSQIPKEFYKEKQEFLFYTNIWQLILVRYYLVELNLDFAGKYFSPVCFESV